MAVETSPYQNPWEHIGHRISDVTSWGSRHWKSLSLAVTTLGGLGGAYYIGYMIGTRDLQVVVPTQESSPEIKPSPQVLSALETHQLSAKLLEQYLSIRMTYSQLPAMELTLEGLRFGNLTVTPELTSAIHQHLIDGLYLAKISLSPQETSGINYDSNRKQATFLNRTFDLNDPLQFQLLAGITELKLQKQLNNIPFESSPGQSDVYIQQLTQENAEKSKVENEKKERDIQHLLWLYDHGMSLVTIDTNSFLFLPPRDLVSLSQTLQALQRANLPSPQLTYTPPAPGAEYLGSYGDGQVDINSTLRSDTATHEITHFLADAHNLDSDNPRLQEISQNAFNTLAQGILSGKDMARYISARDEQGKPSLVEEYAQRMADYKNRGDSFRSRIKSLEQGQDPTAYQVAKTEYDFMKALFGDQEFTDEGELVGTGERMDPIYNIGTRVAVLDTSRQNLGILLRKNPTDALDPSLPVVYNGAEVEILEGPVEITDLYLNQTRFWKIRIIWSGLKGDTQDQDNFGEIGWVSEGYLGEILPLPSLP